MIYIGIDNGISGALVAISSTPGVPIINMTAMPTKLKAPGGGKGKEVDIREVATWINDVTGFNKRQCTIIIERPGKHSPGLLSLCSMWDSFGRVVALAELKGLRRHIINPQAWQKVMLPGCAKGNTKPAAEQVARQIWPEETWLRSSRCSDPDTGLIDAALIAEYARRAQL